MNPQAVAEELARDPKAREQWDRFGVFKGATLSRFHAEQIDQLLSAGPHPSKPSAQSGKSLTAVPASEFESKQVSFAWEGRLPFGHISLLVGREGLGKSQLTAWLAAQASRGTLPGDLREPVNVLIASAEDDPGDTIRPRLEAAGADLSRTHILGVAEEGQPGALTLPEDIEPLAEIVKRHEVKLLILDPLVAFLASGKIDAHRDQDVRRALGPLTTLAQDYGVATLALMHLNKGQTSDVLARISGSVAFSAAARSTLALGEDPNNPDGRNSNARVLAHGKCNLAPLAPSLECHIEGVTLRKGDEEIQTSRIVIGDESSVRADDLLTGGGSEERGALADAKAFVMEELCLGPVASKGLIKSAREAGISQRTLERARHELGVKRERRPDGWYAALEGID